MQCEFCSNDMQDERCPSCELYDAACDAQDAAAKSIAASRTKPHAKIGRAWLNDHGIFAMIDGIAEQLGTPEEAAAFDCTTRARAITTFWEKPA